MIWTIFLGFWQHLGNFWLKMTVLAKNPYVFYGFRIIMLSSVIFFAFICLH